jgi:hypothetical protein
MALLQNLKNFYKTPKIFRLPWRYDTQQTDTQVNNAQHNRTKTTLIITILNAEIIYAEYRN